MKKIISADAMEGPVTLTATAIDSEWTPAFASTTFEAIKPP
jgi:hypothetical protein